MKRGQIIVAAAAVALVAASAALGHSGVVSTTPASGSVVRVLPATITVTFADRLLGVTGATVRDSRGVDHAVSARRHPRNAARIVITTRRPVPGVYTVLWRVRSEDGHAEAGSFRFRARGR